MAAIKSERRPISATRLAALLECSPRMARRYWAQSRGTYEARSVESRAPWAAENISRATWYRRRLSRYAPLIDDDLAHVERELEARRRSG